MRNLRQNRTIAACMTAAVLGFGSQAVLAATVEYPAGIACQFPISIVIGDDGNFQTRELKDRFGIVRTIGAGTGSSLVFTNLTNNKTFSTKSNGAVWKTTYNADGTITYAMTGHNVLILFPTDDPAGPSTTLYGGGRLVYTNDLDAKSTVKSAVGNITNICAALT